MKRAFGVVAALAFAATMTCGGCAGHAEAAPSLMTAPTLTAPDGTLTVKTVCLNRFVTELDGQWQGNIFASDGNCYFFSSTHEGRHGAAFFRYDPRTQKLTMLCDDITKVCGEDPLKTVPQGKVHSDVWEFDGRLYFATHLARYNDREATAYPGAHILAYEIATGRWRDYGVIREHYSIYSGFIVDPKHKVAYMYVRPFNRRDERADGPHIYRLNLVTGGKEDLGMLRHGGGAVYHFFLDADGNCWFPLGSTLYRIRPDSSKPESWPGVMPDGQQWCWTQALPGGKQCFFTPARGAGLWLFDATKAPSDKDAFRKIADIGPTELGMTLMGDRIYYSQRAERKDWGRSDGADRDMHLCSVSLSPDAKPRIIDHGLLVDQDGRRPWKLASFSNDGKGRLFLVGAWHCLFEEGKLYGHDKGGTAGLCAQFFTDINVAAAGG